MIVRPLWMWAFPPHLCCSWILTLCVTVVMRCTCLKISSSSLSQLTRTRSNSPGLCNSFFQSGQTSEYEIYPPLAKLSIIDSNINRAGEEFFFFFIYILVLIIPQTQFQCLFPANFKSIQVAKIHRLLTVLPVKTWH